MGKSGIYVAGSVAAVLVGMAGCQTTGDAGDLGRPLSAPSDRVLPPLPAQPPLSIGQAAPTPTTAPSAPPTGRLDAGGVPVLPEGAPVVVEDEQGQDVSDFPIAAAVAAWHLPGVTLGACDERRARCVRVVEVASLPPDGKGRLHTGLTTRSRPGVARVQLSQQTPVSLRLEDTVHELGHAFGLGHRKGTVMEPDLSGRFSAPTPAQRGQAATNIH